MPTNLICPSMERSLETRDPEESGDSNSTFPVAKHLFGIAVIYESVLAPFVYLWLFSAPPVGHPQTPTFLLAIKWCLQNRFMRTFKTANEMHDFEEM